MQDSLYKKISNDSWIKEYKINEILLSVLDLESWNLKYPCEKNKSSTVFNINIITLQNFCFESPSMEFRPNTSDINTIIEYEALKDWSKNSVYLCKQENEREHFRNHTANIKLILDPDFYSEEERANILYSLSLKSNPNYIDPIRPLIRKHLDSSISIIDDVKLDLKVPPLYFFRHNSTGYFKLVAVFKGLENNPKSKNEIVEAYKTKIKNILSHNKDAYRARIKGYEKDLNQQHSVFPQLNRENILKNNPFSAQEKELLKLRKSLSPNSFKKIGQAMTPRLKESSVKQLSIKLRNRLGATTIDEAIRLYEEQFEKL